MPITQISPLRFEPASGPFAGSTWTGETGVCPDPSCGCHNLDIEFRNGDKTQVLQVDVGNPVIRSNQETCDTAFSKTLSDELDLPQLRLLHDEFYRLKKVLYADTDLTRLEYDFPYQEIEEKGLLIAYNRVFPLHQPMIFDAGGPFIATERYCVVPHCDCTKANAVFFRYDANPGPNAAPLFEIDLDVEAGAWAFADCPPTAAATAIVEAFLNAFGYSLLGERRRTLRDLYAWNRELFYLDLSPAN